LGQQDHIPIVTGLTVALMAAADADALDNFIWFTSYYKTPANECAHWVNDIITGMDKLCSGWINSASDNRSVNFLFSPLPVQGRRHRSSIFLHGILLFSVVITQQAWYT
jgi:hypothetical protein